MKKIFTLIALLICTVSAMATDYTDQMTVTINGTTIADQPATIIMERQDNGMYTLKLNNLILPGMPVGNILLDHVAAEESAELTRLSTLQVITITAGEVDGIGSGDWLGPMLPPVPVNLGAELRDNKLYAVIDIDMTATLGQVIKVVFGNGNYQIANSGFELFHTATTGKATSDEPNNWHSFMSCSGAYAGIVSGVPHTFISEDVRPGTLGSKSVLVKSGLVFTIVANGTLTTGRLQAGAMSATDPKNCSFSDLSTTDVDANGDPFFSKLNGYPDSLVVWVKFKQGTPSNDYPYATLSAVITDGTYYQDPEDKAYSNWIAKASNATIASNGFQWQRLSVPFEYVEGSELSPKAIHVTLSTNAAPGQGSGADSLLVDDLELIYNSDIASISVKGANAELNVDGIYEVTADGTITADDILVTTTGCKTTVSKELTDTEGGVTVLVTVVSNDLKTTRLATLLVKGGNTTGVADISHSAPDAAAIYNLNGQRITDANGRHLVIKKSTNGKNIISVKAGSIK